MLGHVLHIVVNVYWRELVCWAVCVRYCCKCVLEGVGLLGRELHIVVNVYWRELVCWAVSYILL